MMRVLSDVYPPHIKPVRDGWYMTSEGGRPWLREFRQGSWRYADGTARLRKFWVPWRGLAFCPYSAIAITHTDVSIASQRVYEIEGVFVPGATTIQWPPTACTCADCATLSSAPAKNGTACRWRSAEKRATPRGVMRSGRDWTNHAHPD